MAQAPTGQDRYHQGYYKIQNVSKYIGNPVDIVYRSSWEYRFMLYCDLNDGVKKWGSEIYKIPYVDYLGHSRSYIPDFYLETVNSSNPDYVNKFLVEVKPEAETKEPIIPKTISEKKLKALEYQIAQWQKNKYKWAYAKEWCKSRDITFWLVTEYHIKQIRP
jgi:hypothetical protein